MSQLRMLARDPRNLVVASLAFLLVVLVALSSPVAATQASFTDSHPGSIGGMSLVLPPTPSPAVLAQCDSLNTKDTVIGTDGDDVIDAGNGKTLVLGLGGNDTLTSGNGKDCLVGGTGDDRLESDNGPDVLLGGPGDDILIGGNGPETLDGGDGYDICVSGRGQTTLIDCESTTLPGPGNPERPAGAQPSIQPDVTPMPDASATSAPLDGNVSGDPTQQPTEPAPPEALPSP